MTEPFKIWRNSGNAHEPITYIGDFYPPNGRWFLGSQDLVELGLAPGEYTVRVPESFRLSRMIAKWQKVRVER